MLHVNSIAGMSVVRLLICHMPSRDRGAIARVGEVEQGIFEEQDHVEADTLLRI